jgi:hypothetical protein
MSVRLKINVLRFRQLSIVVPLRCPAAREDTMGRGAAQAVVEAASDLIGRSDFGGRTALQAAASMGLPPGIYILLKKQSRYSRHFRYRLISLFVQARSDSFRKAASIATQGHRAPFRG